MAVRTFLFILLFFPALLSRAQDWPSPEAREMYQQGMSTLSRGNAQEAVAIFQRTLQVAPNIMQVRRSLAQAYQLSGEYDNANKVLAPLLGSQEADPESYRISAQAYSGLKDEGKARRVLSDGIARFPEAGVLYYETGLSYERQDDYEKALKSWLDGIEHDPIYHLNYFEAAMAYMRTDNAIWPIIYGEIFLTREPNTQRSFQARVLLLDAYKKLFFTPSKNITGDQPVGKTATSFEEAVKQTYTSLFYVVSDGINTENLTMLRTRFLVSWYSTYAARYPFALFDYQEQLARNGSFDAYNQWLFGKVEDAKQYELWAGNFSDEMKTLEQTLQRRPLQMSSADNYNHQRNFRNQFPKEKNVK